MMRRQVGLLSRTALCTVLFLTAAGLPASAASYTFSDIRIEGNALIDPATILSFAAVPKGQSISDGALNDVVQRLNDSGLFASVDVVPSGGTLIIRVVENPTINIINFEGNKKIKDEDLAKVIKSQSRRVYSAAQAEADAQALIEAYTESGRLAARIEPRVIDRGDNKVDLVFEIREGKVTEVERLSFTGNRAFSDRRLRQVLETKQAGIFRQIIQRDTFVADRVDVDKQLLVDFYRSRGYIDAAVTSVSSEFSTERDGFFLTFAIREGLKYSFDDIRVVSEVEGIDATEFGDLVRLRKGVAYSPTAIDTTITRLENLAVKKGLDFVSVEPRISRDEATQTLDVTFVLTKGPKVFVERIDIEGNATTLDKVVRRQFRTVEGDPFNPREIRQSAERVRALGYFKDAQVNARGGSSEDQVIVDVNVEEKPTGSLNFGASYSVSDGLGFNIGLTEANFLGRGQYVNVKIGTTADQKDSGITFIEPSLLDRDLKLKLSAWYRTSENANSRYSTKRLGFSPSLEFPLAERTRLELSYKISSDEIFDVDTNSSSILKAEEARGSQITSSIGYQFSFDTERFETDPTSRLLLTFGQDFAGVGGDIETITTTGLAKYQKKVFNEEVTLRAEFEAGAVVSRSADTRLVDRFTGNGKIRGFESNGIGPRDLSVTNQDALGGNMFAALRLDAEFPLGLPEEYGITGGVFADIGSVWGLDSPGGVDDAFHVRSSIGVSILWDSTLGPLRFNFSKAIQKESYDKEQTFDFTVSTQF
ncbi:outer membrane protein assembly factor BamA [Frigidibacter sp. RF13]|uniref:outer membrane protein assembly factor BamA n=1 Tax=Frigidibacter sp. RF13 TaxID=2997340 RepID=UPI003B63E86B